MSWMSRKGLAFAGGVLLLAATSAFAAPQDPVKSPSMPPPSVAPATPPAAPTQETARRISVTEARLALAKGEAVLVDVRPKEAYAASHADGALSIPLSDIVSRAGELPKDKLVITYCT
jgi:3-mercaptopyruvate sulfurtransferase SseA